jgi:hypothetical protein
MRERVLHSLCVPLRGLTVMNGRQGVIRK